MNQMIFVNLPVRDLPKSMAFFRAMGWDFDLDFTDDQGACLIISDTIFVMLLVEEYFMSFTHRSIPTRDSSEVILSLSAPNKQEVDRLLASALAAGASETSFSDLGWMYQRGFADLDGHLWEVAWMDSLPPKE